MTNGEDSSCTRGGTTIGFVVKGEDFRDYLLSRRRALLKEAADIERILRLKRQPAINKLDADGK